MAEQISALRPTPTKDDIEALVAFIYAQVDPLRDAASYGSDEERAFQALADVVTVIHGVAEFRIEAGKDCTMLHHYLTTIARRWKSHPDYRPEWRP